MKKTTFLLSLIGLLSALGFSCNGCSKRASAEEKMNTFVLKSDAILKDDKIPPKFTCDKEDISLPLTWANPPSNTQTFALIVLDPDANPEKPFVHWVMW